MTARSGHPSNGLIRGFGGLDGAAWEGRAEPVKAARSAPEGLGLDGRASANTLELGLHGLKDMQPCYAASGRRVWEGEHPPNGSRANPEAPSQIWAAGGFTHSKPGNSQRTPDDSNERHRAANLTHSMYSSLSSLAGAVAFTVTPPVFSTAGSGSFLHH